MTPNGNQQLLSNGVIRLPMSDFAEEILKDPTTTFMTAEWIAVPFQDKTPYGRVHVLPFMEDRPPLSPQDTMAFTRKFIVFGNQTGQNGEPTVSTLAITTSHIDPQLLALVTQKMQQSRPHLPADHHFRWHMSGPEPPSNGTAGKIHCYLTHQDLHPLIIEPDGLDGDLADLQVIYQPDQYVLHFLTKRGTVYESELTPAMLRERKSQSRLKEALPCRLVFKDARCVLTVYRPENVIRIVPFYGTAHGIVSLNNSLLGTENLPIQTMTVDSVEPRIYCLTDNGRIYGVRTNNDFTPKARHSLTLIDTIPPEEVPGTQLLAGPNITKDGKPALLIARWEKGPQPKLVIYHRKVIPLPKPLVP